MINRRTLETLVVETVISTFLIIVLFLVALKYAVPQAAEVLQDMLIRATLGR